ncbi:MAG TPA: hypothetical protein PLG66_16585 [Calditrichia bacterium]|nr:hypothetical protein [Calditrichia bacterium]
MLIHIHLKIPFYGCLQRIIDESGQMMNGVGKRLTRGKQTDVEIFDINVAQDLRIEDLLIVLPLFWQLFQSEVLEKAPD